MMEKHEELRHKELEKLKEVINKNITDPKLKDTFNEVYDSISLVSDGVDDAHMRLDHRKGEIKALGEKIDKLQKITLLSTTEVQNSMKKTNRNSKISMIATLVSVFFSLFLIFGGAEALKQLGFLTTAIKTLEIII